MAEGSQESGSEQAIIIVQGKCNARVIALSKGAILN